MTFISFQKASIELSHSSILIEYNDPCLTCLVNYEQLWTFFLDVGEHGLRSSS